MSPSNDAGTVRLHFIGDGSRYVIGVPTTDIEVPVEQAERLTETGLYELADGGEATAPAAGDQTPEGPSETEAPTATEPSEAPTGE